ncbi:MAG TPA: spore coat U domain-containing protein [Thermopetrobacter sp.]|nr:spore coat U domain-containing protein [Thermopetrobacter sp.]
MILKRAVLGIVALAWATAPALAQSCSLSLSSLNFGSIDIINGAGATTAGTFSAFCWGTPGRRIIICPNIGAGSGGVAGGGDPRHMANGADKLAYNIFHPSGGAVWGSWLWPHPPRPPTFIETLSSTWWFFGWFSRSWSMPAAIPAGQTGIAAGSYLSTFSSTDVQIRYAYYTPGMTCDTLSGAKSATASFSVSATVQPACAVSATNMNFGTAGMLGANIDASNTITVTCTKGTSYRVSLSQGGGGGGPGDRRMSGPGGQQVVYGIYRDAARTLPWGTSASNNQPGVGNGAAQTLTAYGRVPPQPTPQPGVYSDYIVVTVSY